MAPSLLFLSVGLMSSFEAPFLFLPGVIIFKIQDIGFIELFLGKCKRSKW